MGEKIMLGGQFVATLYDRYKENVKWSDTFNNLVVSTGLQYILKASLTGGTQVSTWYTGILGASPTVSSADRMSTYDGFTESTLYSEANRPIFVEAISGVSVSNSANKSTFTLNTDGTTIGGAMLVSSNSKGGTAGVLLCGAAFTGGNKTGDSGDVLEVQYTFTAADDGA